MSRLLRTLLAAVLLLSALAFESLPSALAATGAADPGAVTVTKTVTRSHLQADGTELPVDSRTVTLRVDQTRALRSRQPVRVSWSGARPTAGLVADPNSPDAAYQEYPFVLLECRGTDTAAAPLTPSTCWTGTTRERYQSDSSTGFGPWRLDRFEPAAKRTRYVGQPSPLPPCHSRPEVGERWQDFLAVSGKDYVADSSSCPSVAPETVFVDNAAQPSNNTYAATQPDGSGSTKFTIWTSEDNASLGCGGGVACSLVAVPIMGISCDPAALSLPVADRPTGRTLTAATKACEAKGSGPVGQPSFGGVPDLAVTGALWFSASNWRNRIAVPLDFAPLNNVCDLTGGRAGVDVYGSELATQLTAQWRPAFCLDRTRTPFKHVQVGEPQAANLLNTGNVDGALLSDPPDGGFSRPTVVAPLSLTGFAIAYAIDGSDKQRYTGLKLTPRLLAKLLTESYPGIQPVQSEYAALAHNPLDISRDPEFQALNPGIPHGVGDSAAASTLLTLSSDSDVIRALTTYLDADPDAHDWLTGIPDPWGMVVNPSYSTNPRHKGHLVLPTDNWPLRDTFEPAKYYASGVNPCLTNDPAPILPLIAAPTARLASITTALQFATSSAQIACQTAGNNGSASKLVAEGRQPPGSRFVLGVTSLGDAARYDLDTAALQTTVAPDADEQFTSAKGRTFVAPTDAALTAAAKVMTPDDTTGTWDFPYATLTTNGASAGAYPGAMMLSLAVPTSGLAAATAHGLSQLLSYAAGPGQVRGLDPGQVPYGYLPLTAANGLGAEQAYTARAAGLVAAQAGGTLTPSGATTTTPVPTASASATPPPAQASQAPPATLPGGGVTGGTGPAALPLTATPQPVATLPVSAPVLAAPVRQQLAAVTGITGAVRSTLAAQLFPVLAVVAAIGLLTSVALTTFGRPRATA